ncbi:hypothetical protein RJ639_039704 [Escallonia herrerae]|uniref:Uncharacterized protein n=1 Tax=Escallonia herrerae TaxID=1293975 RepID=A0AA88WMN5_9ASTE|nr:hypothetical protein RJ639_039704 [Escallonia herrerae]
MVEIGILEQLPSILEQLPCRGGNNPSMFKEFKNAMSQEFEITTSGSCPITLALRICEILKNINMDDANPMSTSMECGVKLSKKDVGKKISVEGASFATRRVNTEIFVNNKSAIVLAKNSVFHDRNKHINTRYYYIRECITEKAVELNLSHMKLGYAKVTGKANPPMRPARLPKKGIATAKKKHPYPNIKRRITRIHHVHGLLNFNEIMTPKSESNHPKCIEDAEKRSGIATGFDWIVRHPGEPALVHGDGPYQGTIPHSCDSTNQRNSSYGIQVGQLGKNHSRTREHQGPFHRCQWLCGARRSTH